jgi:hypothetical protein
VAGGQGKGSEGQDGDEQQPAGQTGERFKITCGYQSPRSFWICAWQYTPGADHLRSRLRTQDPVPGHEEQVDSHPARRRSSSGMEANPSLIGKVGDPLGPQHRR